MFAQTLAHLLFPRYSNDQKAKLLHPSTLFLTALFIALFQVVLLTIPKTGVKVLGYAANISPDEVIRLSNQKRAEAGLAPLQYNSALSQAAKAKGEHMLANDYWAHTAPDGTEPWKFFTDAGYRYRYAGENLARDFSNPQAAIDAWMASPSHKENLMSGKYKEIGIGVVEGDLGGVEATIIVQLFGTQLVDTTPEVPIGQAQAKVEVTPSVFISATPQPTQQIVLTGVPTVLPTQTDLPNFIASNEGDSGATGKPGKILISPFSTTRSISLVTIISLLGVMVVDVFVSYKRKLPRISGRTFAHFIYLVTVGIIVLLAKAGNIL